MVQVSNIHNHIETDLFDYVPLMLLLGKYVLCQQVNNYDIEVIGVHSYMTYGHHQLLLLRFASDYQH